MLRSDLECLTVPLYRDKKVVGVFVRFAEPLHKIQMFISRIEEAEVDDVSEKPKLILQKLDFLPIKCRHYLSI
jgi:hypothetical protein